MGCLVDRGLHSWRLANRDAVTGLAALSLAATTFDVAGLFLNLSHRPFRHDAATYAHAFCDAPAVILLRTNTSRNAVAT